MERRRKWKIGMSAITIGVFTVAAVALAQGPGSGSGFGSKGLDLSEDQETKIEALRLDMQKEMIPLHNQLDNLRSELHLLMTEEKADQGAIDQKIEAMSQLRTKIQKKRTQHHLAVRSILNKEQRVKFDQRMLARGNGHGFGHGPGFGATGKGKGPCGQGFGKGFKEGPGGNW